MSAFFALIVLSASSRCQKTIDEVPPLRFTNWMETFQYAWQRTQRARLLLLGVALLTVVAIFGVSKLRFEGDISKLNGITEPTRSDDKLISATWGDALGLTLVIARGKTVDEALAENDRAAALLASQTNVTGIYSLSTICPSPALQLRKPTSPAGRPLDTSDRQAALHQALAQIGGDLGFRTNAFDPFWKSIEDKPALITLDQFKGTALEEALSERVSVGDQGRRRYRHHHPSRRSLGGREIARCPPGPDPD